MEQFAKDIDRYYSGMVMICLSQGWTQEARDWDRARFAALSAVRKEIEHWLAML
jgi:hypothetical protein